MISPSELTGDLGEALKSYLRMHQATKFAGRHFVSGILDVYVKPHVATEPFEVPVCVVFGDDWTTSVPSLLVNSNPPWLRFGEEWHVSETGSVCLEWHEQWSDHLRDVAVKTEAPLADLAAQWITRSAANILHVHITCHALGRKRWPKNIPFWAHYDDAREQYRRLKMQAQRPKKKQ